MSFLQPCGQRCVSLDKERFILGVDHLSRQCSRRLADIAQHRVVHRYLAALAPLRIVRCERCGLFYRPLRRLKPVAADYDVAAVHLLGVQPIVRAPRELCSQLVVLRVAAANEYFKAVVRDEFQRGLCLDALRLSAFCLSDISGRNELAADVLYVAFTFGALQLVKHAV